MPTITRGRQGDGKRGCRTSPNYNFEARSTIVNRDGSDILPRNGWSYSRHHNIISGEATRPDGAGIILSTYDIITYYYGTNTSCCLGMAIYTNKDIIATRG